MRPTAPPVAAPAALVDLPDLAPIALERSPTPMVITDPRQVDNPIVLANQAFLDMCGYPADEVIGRNCRFLQGRDTDAAAVAALRDAVTAGREVAVELLNYRRDGAAYLSRVHLSPVYDEAGGLVYFFAAQIDLNPQLEAEALRAAERRLLREVDHRAMNALALVQGILRLTQADKGRPYIEAVQARVAALARAHQLLSARGWSPAPLADVVRSETAAYEGPRLSLDGPNIELGAQQVQPLILVLHEVTQNAVQHGALGQPDGSVAITWRCDDRAVVLCWIEHGCPGAAAGPPGFGSKMIDAILRRQLGGAVQRSWTPDGLTLEMSLPISNETPAP